jgi:hypothetical protein
MVHFQTCDWPSLTKSDVTECEKGRGDDELLDFLDQLEADMCNVSRREHEAGALFRIWKQRRKVFSEESVMYRTLLGEPEVKGYQRNLTALNCQHSCLIYLGVAFADYATEPDVEEEFLNAMENLTGNELCRGLSPEHLLARLLMGLTSEGLDVTNGREEKVMRLMLEFKAVDSNACSMMRKRVWDCLSLSY